MTGRSEERARSAGRSGRRKKTLAVVAVVLAAVVVGLYVAGANLYIVVYGNVLSAKYAVLRAGSKGAIERIEPMGRGRRVREGQLILRLESEVEQSEVVRCERELAEAGAELAYLEAQLAVERERDELASRFAKLELDEAEIEFRRIGKLHGQGAASEREFEAAKAAHRLAQAKYKRLSIDRGAIREAKLGVQKKRIATLRAQLERAKAALGRRMIRAPLSGLAVLHALSIGQVVDANEVLGQIFDDRSYQVVARVPERYLPYLRKGQAVSAELSAYPEYDSGQIRGQVQSVVPVVQPHGSGDGTFRIHAALTQVPSNVRLKAGMSAEVSITVGRTRLLWKLLGMLPGHDKETDSSSDDP